MGCHGNHAFKYSQNKIFPVDSFFGGDAWGPIEQFDTHGTCNMILIARFKRSSSFFVFFTTPKNTISALIFLGLFSMKQDTFLILKLLIKFLKELVVG